MRKLTLSALLTLTLVVLAPISAQEGKKGPNPFAGPFKNLQVLKPDQVQPMMLAARRGFGQACTYCHVAGDFASDDNPKKAIGRMMMTMVGDINARFPDGKAHVSCFTCHRGEVTPPAVAPEPPAAGKQ